jgi:glucose/arabinose dehydrogenase
MKYLFLFATLLLCAISGIAQTKDGFVKSLVTNEVENPSSMIFAPDGRIFITEKSGGIRIIEQDALLETPFLTVEVDDFGERGLQSVVLDPEFESNGYIYYYYTAAGEDVNKIARVTANGNQAVPGSDTILFVLDPLPGTHHNGGALEFTSDGKLLVGVGDGEKGYFAQDTTTVLGKMLRINPDGSIPEDNPFYDRFEGKNRAIYAIGFRNPFTFDIDPVTNQIFMCDVGNESFEEINILEAGGNYGWWEVEGPATSDLGLENYHDPHFHYDHTEGCAVIGAAFYRPEVMNFPEEYLGKFIFADFCTGEIMTLNPESGEIYDTLANSTYATNFELSPNGELYFCAYYTGVWKIEYTGSGEPYITEQPANVQNILNEEGIFNCSAVGDPVITYQWFFEGEELEGETSNSLQISSDSITQGYVYCLVSNGSGEVASDSAFWQVMDNSRPELFLELPLEGQTADGGDTLIFKGSATDQESNVTLFWKVDLHHDEHTHPQLSWLEGVDSSGLILPITGEIDTNVWFRVHFKAVDEDGFESSTFRDVHPNKSWIKVSSSPTGFPVIIDGFVVDEDSIRTTVGIQRAAQATEYQQRNDSLFHFQSWSTGSDDPILFFRTTSEVNEIIAEYEFIEPYFLGNGNGLLGDYYSSSDPIGQTQEYSDTHQTLNEYWEWWSPSKTILGQDNWSMHLTGYILAPVTDTYTIWVDYRDGIKLDFNDSLYINTWNLFVDQVDSFEIEMEAGEFYPIDLWFQDVTHKSRMRFFWEHKYLVKDIIPDQNLYTDPVLGIKDQTKLEGVQIYPNPVEDVLVVRYNGFATPEVQVLDITGRDLSTGIFVTKSKGSIALDVSSLEKNRLYILEIKQDDSSMRQRFITK